MGKLQSIFFALSNPNRLKIYELCLKEKLNLTQLKEKVGQNYTSILSNVKILEEAGMIQREKQKTDKAQETLIFSKPFKKGTVYLDVYNKIKEELKNGN
jgi:predicted transcriptional regulator